MYCKAKIDGVTARSERERVDTHGESVIWSVGPALSWRSEAGDNVITDRTQFREPKSGPWLLRSLAQWQTGNTHTHSVHSVDRLRRDVCFWSRFLSKKIHQKRCHGSTHWSKSSIYSCWSVGCGLLLLCYAIATKTHVIDIHYMCPCASICHNAPLQISPLAPLFRPHQRDRAEVVEGL